MCKETGNRLAKHLWGLQFNEVVGHMYCKIALQCFLNVHWHVWLTYCEHFWIKTELEINRANRSQCGNTNSLKEEEQYLEPGHLWRSHMQPANHLHLWKWYHTMIIRSGTTSIIFRGNRCTTISLRDEGKFGLGEEDWLFKLSMLNLPREGKKFL